MVVSLDDGRAGLARHRPDVTQPHSVRRATNAVLALTAAAVIGLRFSPVYDPDAFWHLATGRWILAHRAIPRVDVFSHTALGRPLQFVDALADLALYAAYALGGYGAVALLTGALGWRFCQSATSAGAARSQRGSRRARSRTASSAAKHGRAKVCGRGVTRKSTAAPSRATRSAARCRRAGPSRWCARCRW